VFNLRGPIGPHEWSILLAVARYRPQPYPGRVAAFLGDAYQTAKRLDTRLSWRHLVAMGLDVKHVPGRRSRMFAGENGRALAEHIEIYLASLDR
jgi:hypothetical protein